MKATTLQEMQKEAARYITGGMSSSFRANQFTGLPMFVQRADGPRFVDYAGREYIDFFLCHGAVLLGHNRPEIRDALVTSLSKGFFAGYDTQETIELGRKVCRAVPSAQSIRFVNSGTEGTLLSLRLARGYTGRHKIVRIDGHFHGCHDYLFANNLAAKVDLENDGTRRSRVIGRTAGVPRIIDEVMIAVPWNNPEILERVLKEEGDRIAGIIMNVIDYNNGVFLTTKEYLQRVRALANQYDVVLIFDEILSGFKTGLSCGQGYYGVTPDICILGKALTNDVPLAIVAGKKPIMDRIMDPSDPVIAGGTFSGNQLGVAAGNACMDVLAAPGFYDAFLGRVESFYRKVSDLFRMKGIPAVVPSLGAGFHIFLGTEAPLSSYRDLGRVDRKLTQRFFRHCIDLGLYFHTDFTVSAAHDSSTLDETLERLETAMSRIKDERGKGDE